jgi:drug/metabolite transporter (DMT)-like permease
MVVEKDRISHLLLLCGAAIWGVNFVAMKFLLAEIAPVNLILLRFISGSVLIFLLLFFMEDVKVPLKDFYKLCFLGAIGITVYQFLFIYALKNTSVTNAAVIINTAPLYGGLLSSFLGYEKFQKRTFFAIVLGFVGVYILVSKGELLSLVGEDLKGAIFALIACVLWAFYTILAKPMLDKHSPLKVTTYSMLTGSALLCGFVPFYLNVKEVVSLSFAGWMSLIYSIVFSIVIAFFLWYRGVSKIGVSRTIIYQYSIPVFGTLSAFFILHERLYWSQLIGAAIIFASINLAKHRQ